MIRLLLLALPAGDEPPADPGGGGGSPNFMFLLLILVVVMLLMPLFSRKERDRRKRLTGLKKHDKVVTSGGIFGTIAAIDENTVTLEVSKDVRLKVKRTSVFDVERASEPKGSDKETAKTKS